MFYYHVHIPCAVWGGQRFVYKMYLKEKEDEYKKICRKLDSVQEINI